MQVRSYKTEWRQKNEKAVFDHYPIAAGYSITVSASDLIPPTTDIPFS